MTALTPLEVIRIERAAFRNLLRKEPNLAIGLLEGMARRTRNILDTPPLLGALRPRRAIVRRVGRTGSPMPTVSGRPLVVAWWLIVLVLASACSSTHGHAVAVGFDRSLRRRRRSSCDRSPRSCRDPQPTGTRRSLTCADHGEGLRDCIVSTLDAQRIVLLGPGTRATSTCSGARDRGRERRRTGDRATRTRNRPPVGSSTWTSTRRGNSCVRDRDGDRRGFRDRHHHRWPDRVRTHRGARRSRSGDVVVASGLTEREATALASQARPRPK